MPFGPAGNPYRRPPVDRIERHRATPGDAGRRHPKAFFALGRETESSEADPDSTRLLSMGFRANEIKRPLAQARAEGDPDPVRFVLGMLIQGRAKR